ncbi:hypothetical protein [Bradyrhizobium sp. SYSU BS000235]|uniref:hypothetical protein n=1 Tax=Bradyrhizobium sp. SYSU BS000235 TaxID=3411332 RepID=UPI003C734D04
MTMARHQFSVTDDAGNVIPFANVEVRAEIPGQPLVQLYSDRAGTVAMGNPVQADEKGFVFFHAVGGAYQVRVYLGDMERTWRYVGIGLGAETDVVASGLLQWTVTEAGDVTVESDDADIIIIEKTTGEPTNVILPDSQTRSRPIQIVDGKFDAATNNITLTVDSDDGQTIMGGPSYIIDSNGASIRLTPRTDGRGYF